MTLGSKLLLTGQAPLAASEAALARGHHHGSPRGNDAEVIAQRPSEGDAKLADVRALNLLNRRMTVPGAPEIDDCVALQGITIPGATATAGTIPGRPPSRDTSRM